MAGLRAKLPVGSAQWFLGERKQANELVEQEVEEFTYSARNELDWLNEHMVEILSANQLNVTDIFKTPGKLRGKTPRTARRRNAPDRAPLTDIFAPNFQPSRSSPPKTQFYKQVEQFRIAPDENVPGSKSPAKHVSSGKENTDSGYHGMTEDEMDIDAEQRTPPPVPKHVVLSQRHDVEQPASPSRAATEEQDSFVSAKEFKSKTGSMEATGQKGEQTNLFTNAQEPQEDSAKSPEGVPCVEMQGTENIDMAAAETHEDRMDLDDVRSPSEGSSPVKLRKKSSLTFASLPAREPLVSKHSLGNRISRNSHFDQYKTSGVGRTSQLGRSTGEKSLGATQANLHSGADGTEDHGDEENFRPALSRMESETTKIHHKTSTQRLHDRINMLGQTKEPRTSKSTHNLNSSVQPSYPNLSSMTTEKHIAQEGPAVPLKDHIQTARAVRPDTDDEDDWIAPILSKGLPELPAQKDSPAHVKDASFELRLPQHRSPDRAASPAKAGTFSNTKSISASAVPSPTKVAMAPEPSPKKAMSASYPEASDLESTTPAGSPTRRNMDGPLSASKAKLFSVFKSAKGIFASSAATSAQAKVEVLSPKRSRDQLPVTEEEPPVSPNPDVHPSPALYPNIGHPSWEAVKPLSPARRTRSSTEREKEEKRKEKEAKEKQRMADDLAKARAKEKQKAAASKEKAQQRSKLAAKEESCDEMPPPPPPKTLPPSASQPQTKAREPKRMVKPSKDNLNKPSGPPKPVTVNLPSQRFGQHTAQPNNAALSAGLHDSLAPGPAKQRLELSKNASTTSLQSQPSNGTLKNTSSSQASRPRALDAAMRKKELEEKEAQRKAEHKRMLEQRKAAKLEEERKAEQQRKEEEQRRALEAKKAAQRKAEETRRQEQQRREAARPTSRQGNNDLAHTLQQERSHGAPAYHRSDLGGARPMSQMRSIQDPPRPVNQAKPAKRPFQAEPEDEPKVQRPAMQRNPPSYQQLDAKRRKTDEDQDEGENRRSVMAPPIRHSNIRKEPSKFPHGYTTAPQHPPQGSSMVKSAVTGQYQMHNGQQAARLQSGHPEMSKYANARIPFADAPNPPGTGSSAITANSHTYKTPLRPEGVTTTANKSAPRSSPHYPAAESVQLPDIATDSEDEDSENEFVAPSWAASPFLGEALSQQQLIDPETIFGPIQELKMDEIFKNKDKAKKWRERTSSANWSGTDRLTEEERKRDRLGRERLMKQGAWSFDTVAE